MKYIELDRTQNMNNATNNSIIALQHKVFNATVWTNEKQGILKNTDVLVKDGKIEKEISSTVAYLSPRTLSKNIFKYKNKAPKINPTLDSII